MFRNYIKLAFRHFSKHKLNTFINIFGLAVGFASCIFIYLFVKQEFEYDKFHKKSDRIYRVTHDETPFRGEGGRHLATVGPPTGPALAETFPEILSAVRFRFPGRQIVANADNRFYEDHIVYVDSTLFSVFTFPLQSGDAHTALSEPNSVVITPAIASKYFGEENPIGKVLEMDNRIPLTVTGVFAPIPQNSHLKFDLAISFQTFTVPRGYPVTLESWDWISFNTYLLLENGVNPAELETKFPEFVNTHWPPDRAKRFKLRLQPMGDIYFGDILHPAISSGNVDYLYGLIAVGVLILLLGCFNFMNLSLAYSVNRAREVGIRKVLGAYEHNLMRQFLGESLLTTLLALILSFAIVEFLNEALYQFFNFSFEISTANFLSVAAIFLGIGILVGVFAGSYPALIVSRFQPVKVLKGQFKTSTAGLQLRKILVVFQFAITTAMIAGSIIIADQMNFIRNKNLGFTSEAIAILSIPSESAHTRYDVIRQQLIENPSVISVSGSGGMLDGDNGNVPIFKEGASEDEGIPVNIYGVEYDFFESLDIPVIAGRTFSEDIASDSTNAIVVNQAAAQLLGYNDPVGKPLRVSNLVDGHIIGVVDNFHFASLHHEVEPLVIFYSPLIENIYVRTRPGNVAAAVAALEQEWQTVAPDLPFHFTFLDENLNRLYASDRQFATLIYLFSALAILVACMGLYGLIAFITQQRIKEIGIRKVLGAPVSGILLILSKPLLALVLIANVIAIPAVSFVIGNWLENFAYRVSFGWEIFVFSAAIVLTLAALTIGYHTVRAALANPVKSLRYE